MSGFIDLHSHWVAGVDDGAKTTADGRALLAALASAGFAYVVATPHMRPGMFDNERAALVAAFEKTLEAVGASVERAQNGLPQVGLASEHFVDDVVWGRILAGEGLPYPGGKAVLIEFATGPFPLRLQSQLSNLNQRGVRPVIAHPERYEPVWKNNDVVDDLLDSGAVLQLDVAALAGKYGRAPRKAAEALLESGSYHAASSDAHKASDVDDVREGIELLFKRAGDEEARFLLVEGPRQILTGTVRS